MKEPSALHPKSKFFRRFFTAFIFVLLLIVVLDIVREHFKRRELDQEIASLAAEVKSLEAKKKDFLQSIELYQSDFFIEKEAREKFNLKKSGEMVSVIPGGATPKAATGSPPAEAFVNLTGPSLRENASGWWRYFFGAQKL